MAEKASVTTDDLLHLLGRKDVDLLVCEKTIAGLRAQVEQLTQALAKATAKAEE